MLKNFENWLLENNYSASTSADYMGRIERLCRKEEFTLAYLVENIASISCLNMKLPVKNPVMANVRILLSDKP